MNKKKIFIIVEVILIMTICKIIYDGVLVPIIFKFDNSFTEFCQSSLGNWISWLVVVIIIGTIWEALIKPLIKKIIGSK